MPLEALFRYAEVWLRYASFTLTLSSPLLMRDERERRKSATPRHFDAVF